MVYYHLKALHEAGIQVILHAFQYGERKPSKNISQFCHKVHYYRRKRSIGYQFSSIPFIVQSRSVKELLQNLLKDEHPIFFEGVHTCFFMNHASLKARQKFVRMHNIEWKYYKNLAHLESNLLKRLYFKLESRKLKRFDTIVMENATHIIALSQDDYAYFQEQTNNLSYLPPFHPNDRINCKIGRGDYLLFHGKLSVKDNEKAALYLVEEIAPRVDFPIIIAGLEPTKKLRLAALKADTVSIKVNLSELAMNDLVWNAQIHFLWTYQKAGMKLKLLKSLFNGRHCIANTLMVENTGLEELVWICNNTDEIIETCMKLMEFDDFDKETSARRAAILRSGFSNQWNIEKTIELIWGVE